MANFWYDPETDTWYTVNGDGFGWFLVFFALAAPFILFGVFLKQASLFVHNHLLISSIIFLVLAALLSYLLYHRREVSHRKAGYAAVFFSVLPCWLVQLAQIPGIIENDVTVWGSITWIFTTFFTVGLAFFIIQICLLFNNGLKHLAVAGIYSTLAILILYFT